MRWYWTALSSQTKEQETKVKKQSKALRLEERRQHRLLPAIVNEFAYDKECPDTKSDADIASALFPWQTRRWKMFLEVPVRYQKTVRIQFSD